MSIPSKDGPYSVVRLFHDADEDRFFLVSHDETTALPLPRDLHGHMEDLIHPEHERLNCHVGFVPWSPKE